MASGLQSQFGGDFKCFMFYSHINNSSTAFMLKPFRRMRRFIDRRNPHRQDSINLKLLNNLASFLISSFRNSQKKILRSCLNLQ